MGEESLRLAAPLEKFLCCLGCYLNFLAQLLRNHRASEKLRTNTLSQIRTAAQQKYAPGLKGLSDKFLLPEAVGTRRAFGDGAVPAKDRDEIMLFSA